MARWQNMDYNGNLQGGVFNSRRSSCGENPTLLLERAMEQVNECYLRELGRPARRLELQLLWGRVVNEEMPILKRDLESEII